MENPKHNDTQPSIAVIGLGGVGGYLAGMLGAAWPDVTLVARGPRYDAVTGQGLTLHSELNGEIRVFPAKAVRSVAELPPQDYIFICVKNYSLDEVLQSLPGAVGENTLIIPVMNGVDPGDRVRAALDRGLVVKSLIYIVSFARDDYSIEQQGNFATIYFGLEDPSEADREKLRRLQQIFDKAGIDARLSEDIEADIWRKYILNCAYNVETAYYDLPIGGLRRDPVKAAQYEALVKEAWYVAKAKGIRITEADISEIIRRFYEDYAEGATSSLQRDTRAGRRAETDTFSGYIVREARKLGIDVPVSAQMYEKWEKI